MKIKISLAAAGLLLGSALFAESASISDALKNGTFGGDFSLYGEKVDEKHGDGSGFASGSFNLYYSTDSYYGFKFSAGSRANHGFWEDSDGDYEQGTKAVLHTANVAYSNDDFDVVLGRQEINLNWISDFHEALVGVIKVVPNTQVILGYSLRKAEVDFDAPLQNFDKLGEKGAFVADLQWSGVEGLVINPFFYYVRHLAQWTGAKVDYDTEISDFFIGGTAQYTYSKEEIGRNAWALQAELRGGTENLKGKLGYIQTNKVVGAGSISAAGDNVNPFEYGENIFDANAKTIYGGVSYKLDEFTFGALYGHTKIGEDDKFQELDLSAEYQIDENLALQSFVINRDSSDDTIDDITIKLGAVYSF